MRVLYRLSTTAAVVLIGVGAFVAARAADQRQDPGQAAFQALPKWAQWLVAAAANNIEDARACDLVRPMAR